MQSLQLSQRYLELPQLLVLRRCGPMRAAHPAKLHLDRQLRTAVVTGVRDRCLQRQCFKLCFMTLIAADSAKEPREQQPKEMADNRDNCQEDKERDENGDEYFHAIQPVAGIWLKKPGAVRLID